MIMNVVSLNPAQARFHERCEFESHSGEVYSIQHYVIVWHYDLWQVSGFLLVLWFPPPIKPTSHDITEILLKVVLITKTLTLLIFLQYKIIPVHLFKIEKLGPFIYYSVIGDPFIYCTKIQNKHT